MKKGFVRIAAEADLMRNGVLSGEINGHEIALFRVDGRYYAVSNICPHQHAPVLSEGKLEGAVVTCRMHGWRFDITTGAAVESSGRLRNYELLLEDGEIFVRIPEDEAESGW